MPAPLTAQQMALYTTKRRTGNRHKVAAPAAAHAAAHAVSSAHRVDHVRLQPKAAKLRGRGSPDPLAEL